MLQPNDLGLPWSVWRETQWDVISQAVASPKRILLLECPPGIGKTGIALALARLWDEPRTYYLTGTRQLQRQYADLGVLTAMGRANFDCLIEPVKADAAICTVGGQCEHAGPMGVPGCGYYDQKRRLLHARESVWNYPFFLYQTQYAGFPIPDILVCDEAHTARSQIASFVTIRANQSALKFLSLDYPPGDGIDFWHHQVWAKRTLDRTAREARDLDDHPPMPGDKAAVTAARRLSAVRQACVSLLAAKDEWVIKRDQFGWEYRPVWPDPLIYRYLAAQAKSKVVFMSATILSKDTFCTLHGLDPEDVEYIQAASVFDKSRRPIRYWPQGKVKRGDYDRVVTAVRTILADHRGDRGLVHSVSYDLAQSLVRELSDPRIITHTGQDREAALQSLRETPGAVLVSPSMTTGVDLPYDLCRFQVICKLPFPDLGDKQIKAAMREYACQCAIESPIRGADPTCRDCRGKGVVTDRRGQLAYNYATVATLVQTYGRIMRADDDEGITYLLDGNWGWFRAANKSLIPRWFSEAIVNWSPPQVEPADIIRQLQGAYA